MSRRYTEQERRMTREALASDPRQRKARAEAERMSLLSGAWEAMAVQTAMAHARRAAEGREDRTPTGGDAAWR